MLLHKYLSFGSTGQQINMQFKWQDTFSLQWVSTYSPLYDALSSKFNYGVCLSRQAVYMNLEGDAIKQSTAEVCVIKTRFAEMQIAQSGLGKIRPVEFAAPDLESGSQPRRNTIRFPSSTCKVGLPQ